jgi:hypothetical protein
LVCDLEKQFNWAKPSFTKPDFKRIPLKHKPFDMRPYQKEALNALLKYEHASIEMPTGCHAKGTLILMYDGSLKKVEDVISPTLKYLF